MGHGQRAQRGAGRRAAAYRARAELRSGWRPAAAVALLIALLGGAVLATAAGARRTAAAYPDLVAASRPPDLLAAPGSTEPAEVAASYRWLASRPEVAAVGVLGPLPVRPLAGSPTSRFGEAIERGLGVIVPLDDRLGRTVRRPHLVDGRAPEPDARDEVLVSHRFSSLTGVTTGDRLDFVVVEGEEWGDGPVDAGAGRLLRVRVTGVGLFASEVVPFGPSDAFGFVLGTRAMASLVPPGSWDYEAAYVDIVDGRDRRELIAELEARGFLVDDQGAAQADVERGLEPLAVSLWIEAGLLAVVSLVVVTQATASATSDDARSRETLEALGSTRGQLAAAPALRASVSAVIGAAGAVGLAVAASPLFPIGPARLAERAPGPAFDGAVLVPGAVVIAMLGAVAGLPWSVRRRSRARTERTGAGPPWLTTRALRSGVSPSAVTGLRWALGRRTDRSLPVRSTFVAVTMAGAAAFGAATFGSSLTTLVDVPARYGQGWDRLIDTQFGAVPASVVDRLVEHPATTGVAIGRYGELVIDDRIVPAVSLRSVKGDVSVGLLDGERADDRGEIVLGAETARVLGVGIGDDLEATSGAGTSSYRVVGIGVFPRLGRGSFATTGLGVGGQVAVGLPGPPGAVDEEGGPEEIDPKWLIDGGLYSFVAIEATAPVDELDADLAALLRSAGLDEVDILSEQPPGRILDLGRVRRVPAAAALLLAAIALAALTHLLVGRVREGRAELSVLRGLGFERRDLRRVVRSYSLTVTAVALVAAVPLGIAGGRTAWRLFASDLDVASGAVTPLDDLATAATIGVVAAWLVATGPAWSAARTADAPVREDE